MKKSQKVKYHQLYANDIDSKSIRFFSMAEMIVASANENLSEIQLSLFRWNSFEFSSLF